MLCGCPLVWKSQLQSHFSQSTLEAEYSALSYALKTLLPIKDLIVDLLGKLNTKKEIAGNNVLKARVFEDNQGALSLANNQRVTSRTKYLLAKFHWFWEHVGTAFTLHKVSSEKQAADYLTKGLTGDGFENNRRIVQNW